MADQNPTDEVISKFNFTGGFPDKSDLAPSIIFIVVVSAMSARRSTFCYC